ncbi:MAG: hypothetical protein HY329_00565 [Chloroflexi bacterium]|nr:hypothetical protein [Chloroflexota bacterium]
MSGKMSYFVYTTDQGERYVAKLNEAQARLPGAGFEPYNRNRETLTGLPRGIQMRYVSFLQPETRRTRRIYCGKPDAPLFLEGGTAQFFDNDRGEMLRFVTAGRTAEARQMVERRR